ncbi:class I SAM-dependent methyltransferase [Sedimentitalea sp. XS_ASV28]|uniref:class I SAM-dependent methyltransferase n=1 Tax=Sedimentitalea sp. XS_ASV28 TaxID=3241296 RepID=UPI0035176961
MTREPSYHDAAIGALPTSYVGWRRSALGRITDALEERLLLDRIGPVRGLNVLDVGCGDGVLAIRLARSGALVTGVDASPEMIAAAERSAAEAGVALTLLVADAEAMPFADASFDIVISVATLCFSDDAERPMSEMARCLRGGGRFVLGELGRWNAWAALRRVKAWLGSPVWRSARFRNRSQLISLARATGFTDANVTGAIFYPPFGVTARLMASIDANIGRWTSAGAAFLVLTATKPALIK